MSQSVQNYEIVKYGTIFALLVSILSSAVYEVFNDQFHEYGIVILALTVVAIILLFEKFKQVIGIFLKERFFEGVESIKSIHKNFEKRIKDAFPNRKEHIKITSLKGIICGIFITFLPIFMIIIAFGLLNILSIEENYLEILAISLLLFFFTIYIILENYIPSFLTNIFDYVAVISWKSRHFGEPYVIFDTRNKKITIGFFETEDYHEILKILYQSGFSFQYLKEIIPDLDKSDGFESLFSVMASMVRME